MSPSQIYKKKITVSPEDIDANGHVNNGSYVQWMQDIAVEHYLSTGAEQLHAGKFTWVVRAHSIVYISPSFNDEDIEIQTWVENVRRVRSLRKYKFIRLANEAVVAEGETEWVFVDIKSGQPRAIPKKVIFAFAPNTEG